MSIVLSRQELYDRVRAEPIQKLSKEFGLSDVGLAKVCRRYGIPVPPRGYWAKKQAGHNVPKAPFSSAPPEGCADTIQLSPQPRPEVPEQPEVTIHPSIAAESEQENRIAAPSDDLRITHPLLRSTRDYWKATRGSALHWPNPLPRHVNIGVSVASRPRALRLLQALFSALEKRRYTISEAEGGTLQVKVLDETCKLIVRERQRQVRGERRRLRDPDLFKDKRPYDLVFTGELELRIEERYGRRSVVADTNSARVEERLNEVVIALVRAALAEKEYRETQERARLAEVERERERANAVQLEREELARIRRFEELAKGSMRHRRLTTFRDELRAAIGEVNPDSELGRWLHWIDGYLVEIDVLETFRKREPQLTLYHCASTYAVGSILKNGFENATPSYGEGKDLPASVAFTNVPMRGIYGGTTCIVIEVSEEDVLPYESLGDRPDYRKFSLPASVANR
jgi:hypothetical protein